MVMVKCLVCDADNDPRSTGGYCDACGKKLPPAAAASSRRLAVGTRGEDSSSAEALRSPMSRTSEALLTVAVLQLVAGGLFLVLGPVVFTTLPFDYLPALVSLAVPPVFLFAALAWLARWQPLPATLAALVAQVLWTGAGFAINMAMALYWLPVSLGVLVLLAWPVRVSQARR